MIAFKWGRPSGISDLVIFPPSGTEVLAIVEVKRPSADRGGAKMPAFARFGRARELHLHRFDRRHSGDHHAFLLPHAAQPVHGTYGPLTRARSARGHGRPVAPGACVKTGDSETGESVEDGSTAPPSHPESPPAPKPNPIFSLAAAAEPFLRDSLNTATAGEDASCGCRSADVEAKHAELDRDQRRRVTRFFEDLGRIPHGLREPRLPALLPPGDLTEGHIRGRWRYFLWLHANDPGSFAAEVRRYEQAHEGIWRRPACQRGVALLHPKDVTGIPLPNEDPPRRPRGGGRRRDPRVQSRNGRIRALFAAHTTTLAVADTLDKEQYPLNASWTKALPPGKRTWMDAFLNPQTTRKVTKLFSKVRNEGAMRPELSP